MKSIQKQYNDLLEGTMSKQNFMRNVRMQFPQYVSSTNSFEDSIRILKGKRILSENSIDRDAYAATMQRQFDAWGEIAAQAESFEDAVLQIIDLGASEKTARNIAVEYFPENQDTDMYAEPKDNRMSYGTSTKLMAPPDEDDSIEMQGNINEAKKLEGVYGHNPNAEMQTSRGIDHLNYYQVYRGIQFELAKESEISDEIYVKVRKKVVDKILKDPDAYKDLQLANFKAVKEIDQDLKMKEVKKDNHKDKPNEMKAVKKDAASNTQDSLGKKEAKKAKNGKGLQHMTQTPKGKLEAFPTPGKEKVMALKEHILDEMTNVNPTHEYINVGSRVKKKNITDYDDSKVGNVTKFDGDTATVKWDNGQEEHVQINVITKKDLPAPKDTSAMDRLPDFGQVTKEDSAHSIKADAELDKSRDNFIKNIYKNTPAEKVPEKFRSIAKGDEDKKAKIKEQIKKAIEEIMLKKGTQTVTADTEQSKRTLKQAGYAEVPNSQDVRAI